MFYIYSISQKLKNTMWRTVGIGSKKFVMSRSLPPRKKEFKILAWNRLSPEASTRRTVRPCSMNFNSTVETVFTPFAPPFQLNAVAFCPSSKNYAPLEIRELHWLFFLILKNSLASSKRKNAGRFPVTCGLQCENSFFQGRVLRSLGDPTSSRMRCWQLPSPSNSKWRIFWEVSSPCTVFTVYLLYSISCHGISWRWVY